VLILSVRKNRVYHAIAEGDVAFPSRT